MKKTDISFRILMGYGGLVVFWLAMTATVLNQTPAKPKPSPTPRRQLDKPFAGARGFEKYAAREASARLIASAGTRRILPGSFMSHYEQGERDYEAGKYEEAVAEFREVLRLKPDWAEAHFELALSLTETEKLKDGIEEFKLVMKLNPEEQLEILSYYNLGNAYEDLGQYEEAVEAYQKAIKLNPGLSKPHNNLGLAYAALARLAEAVAEFNQAVKLRSDYAEAHFNLGLAYLQSGRAQEAAEQQKILVKLKPELAATLDALIKN
jgi:tetratricopeptide (TPR) repeat protein